MLTRIIANPGIADALVQELPNCQLTQRAHRLLRMLERVGWDAAKRSYFITTRRGVYWVTKDQLERLISQA